MTGRCGKGKQRGSRADLRSATVVITCEHGGHRVPVAHGDLFSDCEQVLKSHRGWDPGSLLLARDFAETLNCPLYFSTVTRLLVELNRSRHHRSLFSEYSRKLNATQRAEVLERYWFPYRNAVENAIRDAIHQASPVLHVSVHSFTPVWEAEHRRTDIGLLYDPSRIRERNFCSVWRSSIHSDCSDLTVHRNAPYRGTADGFVTHLRRVFKPAQYIGVELEVNQKFVTGKVSRWRKIRRLLVASIVKAIAAD